MSVVIKDRLEELKVALRDDHGGLFLLEDLVELCASYVETVVKMESSITTMRFRLEGDAYREYVRTWDTRRKLLHNSVTASFSSVDRMARGMGMAPLVEGSIEDRYYMGQLAKEVVDGYYEDRRK